MIFTVAVSYAQYDSVFTNIPSSVAGDTGLALRIDIPPGGRFGDRAPIAIITPGGFSGNGIAKDSPGLVNYGFIEIRYNFPGFSTGEHHSGGTYDFRGARSLEAIRDVILFAMNELQDTNSKFLSEYSYPVIPDHENMGLIAYSYGGVTNINTAGVFGGDFPSLAWILNWESPVGDGMPNAEAGAWPSALRPFNPLLNFAYNPDNGEWDLSSLNYDENIAIPVVDHLNDTVFGGLYFDFNGDDVVNYGLDFIPYPLVFDTGMGYRAFYSERLVQKAIQENIFPQNPPSHIVNYQGTKNFWKYRNGDYWIDSLVTKLPDLLFMVVASDTDHVQTTPDHPHVLNQYRKFGNANAKFWRLNPDSSYISYVLGYYEPTAVDNDAYAVYNHHTIRDCMEPGGKYSLLGRAVSVPAAACELADRREYNVYTAQLDGVITTIFENIGLLSEIKVFPNPCKDNISIYGLGVQGQKIYIKITAVTGEVHYEKPLSTGGNRIIINTGNLKRGVYIMNVYLDNNLFSSKKIIKI